MRYGRRARARGNPHGSPTTLSYGRSFLSARRHLPGGSRWTCRREVGHQIRSQHESVARLCYTVSRLSRFSNIEAKARPGRTAPHKLIQPSTIVGPYRQPTDGSRHRSFPIFIPPRTRYAACAQLSLRDRLSTSFFARRALLSDMVFVSWRSDMSMAIKRRAANPQQLPRRTVLRRGTRPSTQATAP